jgi:hypothetical protein
MRLAAITIDQKFFQEPQMIPATNSRVEKNTPRSLNAGIRNQTARNVAYCAAQGPSAIDQRLMELDHEWDIERYVETMAPTFTLLGMVLGATKNRKWFVLPIAVQAFFLQHAIQGWCPPIPFLRYLGVRTSKEIDHERNALKALRGDFQDVNNDPINALQAARS